MALRARLIDTLDTGCSFLNLTISFNLTMSPFIALFLILASAFAQITY